LEFLYDSGLAVGKGGSSDGGFKALEAFPKPTTADASAASAAGHTAKASSSSSSVPGALFEEKHHSANDAWRKLHSDPLLMIRQREQEALARIKNNPVQMAIIRKSVCPFSSLLSLCFFVFFKSNCRFLEDNIYVCLANGYLRVGRAQGSGSGF
jgi:hypothetical protein